MVKKKILQSLIALVGVGIIMSSLSKADAANSYVPELNVYQQGASPKIEIGIDMDNADVLGTYDFESDSECNMRYGSDNSYGNQSRTSEARYSGNYGYKITDTVSGRTGNNWYREWLISDSDSSRTNFDGRIYPRNGEWLSITYKSKMVSGSGYGFFKFEAAQAANHGIPWGNITYAETVNWATCPERIKVNGTGIGNNTAVYVCTSKNTDRKYDSPLYYYSDGYLYRHPSTATSISSSDRSVFNPGDAFLVRAYPGGERERNYINADNTWHTYSMNFQMNNDTGLYDFQRDGAFFLMISRTNGVMYVDDIKYGKASKVEVKRDNSALVYCDYGSEFTDSSLIIKPETPTLVDMQTLESSINMKLHANTHTEQHSYKARSLGSSGNNPSTWSRAYNVTLTSTPSKYIAKLYKNGTPILDGDMPTNWTYSDVKRGDKITGQVWTVDTEGQKSETPLQINYTVKQTLADYKKDVKKLEDDSNRVAKSYSYEERLNIKGKVTKAAEDLMTNLNLRNHKANVTINNRKENETEFEAGEKLVNIYVN